MNLTISNIAWTAELEYEVLEILKSEHIQAIEVAPTRLWPNWEGSLRDATMYRDGLATAGMICSSLQSLVYGRTDLKLFGTRQDKASMIAHLLRVADVAAALGARPMIFGAPRHRDIGYRDTQDALSEAVAMFTEVAEYCARKGVCLCIEPNPKAYDCNFIMDSRSGADLVRRVNSPGFRLHLDTAGMTLAGEDVAKAIEDCADVLEHIHISEPYLGDFTSPIVDHKRVANSLRAIGWNKWLAIEMKPASKPLDSIKRALSTVRELYAGV